MEAIATGEVCDDCGRAVTVIVSVEVSGGAIAPRGVILCDCGTLQPNAESPRLEKRATTVVREPAPAAGAP